MCEDYQVDYLIKNLENELNEFNDNVQQLLASHVVCSVKTDKEIIGEIYNEWVRTANKIKQYGIEIEL